MEYKSLEIKVGFTVFIASLILIIGLMWFNGFKVTHGKYEIHAIFPEVGGVSPGDKVNLNGVEEGSVKRVLLREKDVLLTMEIDDEAKIPDDSRIVLQAIGIMGGRIVTVELGKSNRYLEPGSIMQGAYEPGITEALAFLGNIMDELTLLTKDMQRLAATLTHGDRLKVTVENLAVASERLRTLLDRDAPAFGAGVQSFRRSADTVDRLLAKNAGRIDTMITSYGAAGRDLPELVRRMTAVTDSLAVLTSSLQRNDNTIGGLMQDRALLDRLEKTVKDLDELVTDVKAHPKKYLKVSLF
ncbi:MAG: MlaD family protein [Candidatus Krumholzibacteriaceae bacterium]|jgi:phospholipid/cholesterol/gamma-HCH transport system substrate-binding protein